MTRITHASHATGRPRRLCLFCCCNRHLTRQQPANQSKHFSRHLDHNPTHQCQEHTTRCFRLHHMIHLHRCLCCRNHLHAHQSDHRNGITCPEKQKQGRETLHRSRTAGRSCAAFPGAWRCCPARCNGILRPEVPIIPAFVGGSSMSVCNTKKGAGDGGSPFIIRVCKRMLSSALISSVDG